MEDGDNNRIRLKIEIETQWRKLIKKSSEISITLQSGARSLQQHYMYMRNNCRKHSLPLLAFSDFLRFCWHPPTPGGLAVGFSIVFAQPADCLTAKG